MTDSETFDRLLDQYEQGGYAQMQLTGRKLRTDVTISPEMMMDDREMTLRMMRDMLYRDMRAALTTTVYGRDIGSYTYEVPQRTVDYLLIWLRTTLQRRRFTSWLWKHLPHVRMRAITIDVREEFPEYHPTENLGHVVLALYRRPDV